MVVRGIEKININVRDYLLMFLLIALSGNPILVYPVKWCFAAAAVLQLAISIINRKKLFNKTLVTLACLSILLFILQRLTLNEVSVVADLNFLAKLCLAFWASTFFGQKFRMVYFRTMCIICAISLICSLPLFFGFEYGFEFDRYHTIGIFNYLSGFSGQEEGYRNCGMFWEPGAFQGYIILVPLLFIRNIKSFFKEYTAACILLVVSLLTTKSTTGYVVLFILVFLLLISKTKNRSLRIILLVLCLGAGYYSFHSLDFLEEKITRQFNEATEITEGDVSWDRFGAAQIDMYNLLKHPISGNGFLLEGRYGQYGSEMTGTGNGFTGALNMYGIPFVLLLLYLLFKNCPSSKIIDKIVYLGILILLWNGEYFFNYPLFWCLIFIDNPKLHPYEIHSSVVNGS